MTRMFTFSKSKDRVEVAQVLDKHSDKDWRGRRVYFDDGLYTPNQVVKRSHDEATQFSADNENCVFSYKGERCVQEPSPAHGEGGRQWPVGHALWTSGKTKFTLSPDRRVDDTQRHAIFITAPPGSGKSVLVNEYAVNWKRLFPTGKIMLFSAKKEDSAFEFEYQLFDVESDTANPFTCDDVVKYQTDKDTPKTGRTPFLCIFDDTSMMSSSAVKAVMHSVENLVKLGRSMCVDVIFTNHEINDSARTKSLHSNCTHHVFFPSTHKHKIRDTLKTRLGLPKPTIEGILSRHDRWFCVTMQQPTLFISPTLVTTIDYLNDYFKDA